MNQGIYRFDSGAAYSPRNNQSGIIITTVIAGDSSGVLLSLRLCVINGGEIFTSTYIAGVTYGAWTPIRPDLDVEINQISSDLTTLIGNMPVADIITTNGLGYNFIYMSPRIGYTLSNAINNNRTLCTANVTAITFSEADNIYIIFFDKNIDTTEEIQLMRTWTKYIKE